MKKEVKVAIFGICILALVYWGISFLRGFDILRSHKTYHVVYEKSDNIEVSSPVLLKGIKVGTVVKVEIADVYANVNVTIEVKSKYAIPEDSEAMISNKSVLGGKAIYIIPGKSAQVLEDGQKMEGSIDNNMSEQIDEVKTKMMNAVDRLTTTLESVTKLLDTTNIRNISAIMANVSDATGDIKGMIHTEKGKIANIIANLDSISSELKEITPRLGNVVANVEIMTDSLSVTLPVFVNNANVLLADVDQTIKAINQRKGTVGKLVYDPQLYDNLTSASDNLSLLLKDLKQQPKRYVSFSLFGRKDKPQKAKKE